MRPQRKPTRIYIIGCGKSKLAADDVHAQDLYTGPLFKARRKHVEAAGCTWYIASAKYGLITPRTIISYYDQTLTKYTAVERAQWSLSVVRTLLGDFSSGGALKDVCVELHMGEAYADYLTQIIPALGMCCYWATKGMSQGEQLAWYKTMQRSMRLGVGHH